MQNRSIGLCIVLSIITCGIYGLYWFVVMTDDANRLNDEANATSGGLALVLNIVTCGIYGIYWAYKMGKRLNEAGTKHNMTIADNSILYLILQIFGLGIINYALMQNDINSMVTADSNKNA